MNNKLLMVRSITLLFRESQIPGNHENSSALVREIVTSIKLPEVTLGLDHERDIMDGLRKTAIEMCDAPPQHRFEPLEILQRLRVNTAEDTELYNAFREGIEVEMAEDALKRFCLNIKRGLRNHFNEAKVQEIISQASNKMRFHRETITDMKKFVAETCALLEPYQIDVAAKDPAVITEVNMNDAEGVRKVFRDIADQNEGTTILRTGFQGINRMLDGGFRRGEEWVIGALQHNYKTGFSLTLFKQMALYNTPILTDPKKKPLMLRISFEDATALNFHFLYTNLKENETGEVTNIDDVPPEEMEDYVRMRLREGGYETYFMHVNPSMWTYRDVCNKILELEADGYEVHMCMLDYLLKLPTTGCDQGPAGVDIRNMYERIRNFMTAKNILVITPHQLSTDAKQMIRDGRQDFVKQLPGRGFYAGCKQIDQVVDGEIFIHIETMNNESYLTIQRGKHRKIKQTPTEHLYCVLPFVKGGGIRDDINGADTTRKKVGAGAIGTAEENPFWDFNG